MRRDGSNGLDYTLARSAFEVTSVSLLHDVDPVSAW